MNLRPDAYKTPALTVELRATIVLTPLLISHLLPHLLPRASHLTSVGSEGFEPPPGGLKVRCAAATPRPLRRIAGLRLRCRRCTGRLSFGILDLPSSFILPSGSPKDRTWRSPVISRTWATSPRLPSRVVRREMRDSEGTALAALISLLAPPKVEPVGVEPTPSWSQTTRAPICTSARSVSITHQAKRV